MNDATNPYSMLKIYMELRGQTEELYEINPIWSETLSLLFKSQIIEAINNIYTDEFGYYLVDMSFANFKVYSNLPHIVLVYIFGDYQHGEVLVSLFDKTVNWMNSILQITHARCLRHTNMFLNWLMTDDLHSLKLYQDIIQTIKLNATYLSKYLKGERFPASLHPLR